MALLRICQISSGAPQIEQGALYPALYRLERQELPSTEWGVSKNSHPRQILHRLTPTGLSACGIRQPAEAAGHEHGSRAGNGWKAGMMEAVAMADIRFATLRLKHGCISATPVNRQQHVKANLSAP
jgi:DNA-binding PadR family transcriptional regulator